LFFGPFKLSNCNFIKGTNLLGNQGQPYCVHFAIPPRLEGNKGVLDLDGELAYWRNYPIIYMSFVGEKRPIRWLTIRRVINYPKWFIRRKRIYKKPS
jgi:hypothetical protein